MKGSREKEKECKLSIFGATFFKFLVFNGMAIQYTRILSSLIRYLTIKSNKRARLLRLKQHFLFYSIVHNIHLSLFNFLFFQYKTLLFNAIDCLFIGVES